MAEGAILDPLEDAYAAPAPADVPQPNDLEAAYAPPEQGVLPPVESTTATEDFTQYYEPPEVAPATAAAVDGQQPISDPALEAVYSTGPAPLAEAAAAEPIVNPRQEEIRAPVLSDLPAQLLDYIGRKTDEMLAPGSESDPLISEQVAQVGVGFASRGAKFVSGLLEDVTGKPYRAAEAATEETISKAASDFTRPEGIASLLSFAVPGVAESYAVGVLSKLPQQYGRVKEAIENHGLISAQTAKAATEAGIQDLMGFLAGKGASHVKLRSGEVMTDAIAKRQIAESVQAEPKDRTKSGETKEAGVSDSIQRAEEIRPQEITPFDFRPALRTSEGIIEGEVGKTHKDIYDAQPDPTALRASDPEHVFLDKNNNELTRDQLEAAIGVRESEQLQKLQQSSKPTEAVTEAPSAEVGIAPTPAVEPAVPEQFKTKSAVRDLLEQQKVEPEEPALQLAEARPEGGALFGAGGKRPPPVKPIGVTPTGDKNFLRIPSPIARLGKGLLTEGVRNALARTKNKVGQMLAKATRQHVDIEQELFGAHEKILHDAVTGISKERREGAFAEVNRYIQDIENKRPSPPLLPDAQKILDAWYDIGRSTGDIARANNVQVQEADGSYRPMGTVQNYIPRMFKSEVESVLRDPDSNPTLFNKLADDLAKHRGVTPEEAATELRNRTAARFSGNDFMSNLELARKEQLPESFYEYDLRNLASRYLPGFSERMAQIIAYGQRLGPREAPKQGNLWDIARNETGGHTESQEWLNVAEDQATNAKPRTPGLKFARRSQALANTFLLSDPTTTVVRNLLSGIGVTTERFGVVRSVRELHKAARTATKLDAHEAGVMREDVGAFLGAEQMGDAKLDNWIRGVQSSALKLSGFSGSENIVRGHGMLVTSRFARDAAASLAKNPKSRLSKEALAYFKRLDVDAEKIVAENGDWKTGPETRKFIRSSVRESQGGYRFDQVPLWAGTTAGRFLYQYGRWAIQRAGDIMRNTVRPALGETVEFRGQKMTRRNVLPLMRLGLITAGLGETFAGVASVLFDKDRRDATFKEIGEAMSEDELKAAGLLGQRITNDIITAGTLGLLSQPIDFFKSLKDQTRFKNPAEPPSLFGVRSLVQLGQKAIDQGGSLTKRDIMDVASQVVRGPKNVIDVAAAKIGGLETEEQRRGTGEQVYQSQNDQRTLRNAARRWAKEEGMDVAPPPLGDFRKAPNAPTFEKINDALMSGDANKARAVADDFIDKAEDPAKAKKAVHGSVVQRHPFRAGQFASDKHQKAFMDWAEDHLPEQDFEQVTRVINIYEQTAEDAGLLESK